MPVYSMSCFKIPKQVVDEITSELRRFWWEKKADKRGITWIAWDKLQLPKDEGGIGFKDLSLFNDSMLAKQAWRLLQHPGSLFARLFKAKYYPHCSLLEATSQRLQSYGWSSILVGLDLLKKGLKYNVGDGDSVKIYKDNWLPTVPPKPAMGDTSSLLTVDSLIHHDINSKSWNEDALSEFLSPEDRNLARTIFLSTAVHEDKLIWAMEKDGVYTVRSGYHLARQIDPGIANVVHGHGDLTLKRRVWKLPIIPKLKHFLWNILARAIPSATRLHSRGILTSPTCSRCRNAPETIAHLFFECPISVSFWNLAQLQHLSWSLQQDENSDANLLMVLNCFADDNLSEMEKLMPCWILWHIWISRNSVIFEHKPINVITEVGLCFDEVREWILITEKQVDTSRITSQEHGWLPPSSPFMKCNVDASHALDSGISNGGWLIRNDGVVVHSWGSHFLGITSSPLEAETKAMYFAVRDVIAKGFRNIIFESDCHVLIKALTTDHCDWSIHNLIKEIHF